MYYNYFWKHLIICCCNTYDDCYWSVHVPDKVHRLNLKSKLIYYLQRYNFILNILKIINKKVGGGAALTRFVIATILECC